MVPDFGRRFFALGPFLLVVLDCDCEPRTTRRPGPALARCDTGRGRCTHRRTYGTYVLYVPYVPYVVAYPQGTARGDIFQRPILPPQPLGWSRSSCRWSYPVHSCLCRDIDVPRRAHARGGTGACGHPLSNNNEPRTPRDFVHFVRSRPLWGGRVALTGRVKVTEVTEVAKVAKTKAKPKKRGMSRRWHSASCRNGFGSAAGPRWPSCSTRGRQSTRGGP